MSGEADVSYPYPITFRARHVKTKHVLLALGLLSLGLASCDDPIARKEFAIAGQDNTQNEVLVPSITTTFNKWVAKGKYMLPQVDIQDGDGNSYWASASNEGYSLLAQSLSDFPVIPLQSGEDTYEGAVIRSIQGTFINLGFFKMGTNVIAGALYTGQVNSSTLINRPLESTLFGQPYSSGIPQELQFTYQYKAGDKVIHGQDVAMELPAQDRASASAVFYEVTDNAAFLNGTNLQTDGRIVAKGYVELAPTEGTDWVTHKLTLEPVDEERYKAIDLENKKYRLAIVFSSSFRGAEYIGAIGSELRLKEVVIKDLPHAKN